MGGRFDNGVRLTLYVSESPEGAMAEYLRRHPEFLDGQGNLAIRLFEVQIAIDSTLDVRTVSHASIVGIPFERLRSSDRDEATRYHECRLLADEVEPRGVSIGYPSAALRDRASNFVVFGPESPGTWVVSDVAEIDLPYVEPTLVSVL